MSLLLFAAGDVVFDVAQRGFGQADGFPYSDVLYLLAYPVLAIALARLARARYDRETAIDSIMVAIALSAVMWQWVVTPILDSTSGASAERIVSVAYPIMDILLVVVIVHAVFTLPRWTPAAWLLFAGLGAMLVADVRLRPAGGRRHLHRRRRARRAVADLVLPARGGGDAPVDARAVGEPAMPAWCATDAPEWSCSGPRCSRRPRSSSSTIPVRARRWCSR